MATQQPAEAAESADAAASGGQDQPVTPLEREKLHEEKERSGELKFVLVRNDGQTESIERLLDLKNIFGKQLPKMGKQYIARLVLDRQHESLACEYRGEVVGGITYRPHRTQAFAEVVFCAVSADHQVRGYGARIMNQLMEHVKREGITHLLTYADNHAIGYFRKQGFHKQVCAQCKRGAPAVQGEERRGRGDAVARFWPGQTPPLTAIARTSLNLTRR